MHMKNLILLLILSVAPQGFAQTENFEGVYKNPGIMMAGCYSEVVLVRENESEISAYGRTESGDLSYDENYSIKDFAYEQVSRRKERVVDSSAGVLKAYALYHKNSLALGDRQSLKYSYFGKKNNVRVNTISQSPTMTTAGSGVKGCGDFFSYADKCSPLGNASSDACADYCITMFSDLTKMVTMQNLFHDGGFSNMGVSNEIMAAFEDQE